MKKINWFIFAFIINFLLVTNIFAAEETFTCELNGYKLEYNTNGKLESATKISTKQKIQKNLESLAKPKNVNECPKSTEYKITIIDGNRTFYVASINEFTTTSSKNVSTPKINSCLDLGKKACENNENFACVWNEWPKGNNEGKGYCNVDKLQYVKCGDTEDIPKDLPRLISYLVNLLKIVTPIILIFVSIISLVKAITSSKEDEMKKAQNSLVKKLISSVMVFLVISIVQFVIMKVADGTEIGSISNCLSCFLNNDCSKTLYYKTNIAGEYFCTLVETGENVRCSDNIITNYYSGQVAENVGNYGYFSNGYQPKGVTDSGEAYELQKTGTTIILSTITSDGISSTISQNLWTANGKCYYWEGKENSYKRVSCDTKVVTPYYIGKKAEDVGNYGYFSNGYQPKGIMDGSQAYKLVKAGKYTFSTKKLNEEIVTITQNKWTANGKCYYWEGRENSYKQIACD